MPDSHSTFSAHAFYIVSEKIQTVFDLNRVCNSLLIGPLEDTFKVPLIQRGYNLKRDDVR